MRIALTGQPVSTRNLSAVALPKRYALPLFGADGISSVAYAADQMILTLAAAGASAPVSYTHLDVYKRQPLN